MAEGFNKKTLKANILAIVYFSIVVLMLFLYTRYSFIFACIDDAGKIVLSYRVGSRDKIIENYRLSGHNIEELGGVILASKNKLPFVYIQVDGKRLSFFTQEKTVEDTIESMGLVIKPLDKVTPSLDTKLSSSKINNISIFRVEEQYVTVKKTISIPHKYIVNPEVEKGKTVVWDLGRAGVKELVIRKVYIEGKLSEEQIISEKIITPPKPKIYADGVAVFRGGHLREFDMLATAYGPPTVDRHVPSWITASGKRVRYGLVAVDPKVIPLGSKLYVENYGYAIAADTGRLIKGNRIDLFFFNSLSELKKFGRRYVTVYLLELPPPKQ